MRTLYLDMDDVIADFRGYATKLLGKVQEGEKWSHEDWIKLRSNERIYRDLDKTTEADELIQFCTEFCNTNSYRMLFLTAVPKGNDVRWAFYDKVLWAQKHYPDIPVMFGPFSKDKQVHCNHGDILIDDRPSNIKEWKESGGIAIQHDYGNVELTIEQLKLIRK